MTLLSTAPRLVGIDVGTKRVGLALSDPLRVFAQPHGAYTPDEALDVLQAIDDTDGVEAFVVGWPLTEEGVAGEATEFVQAYIDRLNERFPDVRCMRQDERYTSEWAKDALQRAGVKQPGRFDKGRVDAAAAAVILQLYLDATSTTSL